MPRLLLAHILRAARDEALSLGPLERLSGLRAGESPPFGDRVPAATVYRVWELSRELGAPPDFAIKAAQVARDAAQSPLRFLCATAPDVGAMIELLARYFALFTRAYSLEVRPAPSRVAIVVRGAGLTARFGAASCVEFSIANVLHCARELTGRDLAPEAVRFAHRRKAPHAALFASYFRADVRFGAHETALVLPRAMLATPASLADPGMHRHFRERVEAALAAVREDADLAERVRGTIAEALADGQPSMAFVARRSGISARTLHRRLLAEGLRFARILDEVRDRMAGLLLDQGEVDGEIAQRLGFSDARAFRRAFQRWRGVTPAAYRAARASVRDGA